MAATGWGEPPVTFALIVMGFVGRCESLLAPDQDNEFILADYADVEHSRIDAYFVPLAERFIDQLNAIGFRGAWATSWPPTRFGESAFRNGANRSSCRFASAPRPNFC